MSTLFFFFFTNYMFHWCLSSGWRPSLPDRTAGERRITVLQRRWQTGNHFQPGHRPKVRSGLSGLIRLNRENHEKQQQTQTMYSCFQALLWTARLLANIRLFQVVLLRPTLADSASATTSWVWGWRWAHGTSWSSTTASGSSCCGLMQLLLRKTGECHRFGNGIYSSCLNLVSVITQGFLLYGCFRL